MLELVPISMVIYRYKYQFWEERETMPLVHFKTKTISSNFKVFVSYFEMNGLNIYLKQKQFVSIIEYL
jgi:hypothetical protein